MSLSDFESATENLLYCFMLVLAVMLPFGFIQPLINIGSLGFTNVEIVIVAAVIIGLVHLISIIVQRPRTLLRSSQPHAPLLSAALIFLLIATISAMVAPAFRSDTLKFVLRIAGGVCIFGLTVYIANTPQRTAGLMWALVIGAGFSALSGLGEAAHFPALERALLRFKQAPSEVGGILRISATFQYTTIASMYYEMAIPLALVLAVRAAHAPARRTLALIIAAVCTIAVVLTLTRSGMVALLILGILYLGLAVWRFRPLLLPAALLLGILLATLGLLASSTSAFRARLLTEDDTDWYNAAYRIPDTLTLEASASTIVNIELENRGQVEWGTSGDRPYRLGYYWVSADSDDPLDIPHREVTLPNAVSPGETIRMEVELEPHLPPGEYRLRWGMLQSRTLWFRHRDVPESDTWVEIVPSASTSTELASPQTTNEPPGGNTPEGGPVAVSRLALWRAAILMWREQPLFGVGPDNFRLLYGSYLGYEDWYRSNHANNLYLEMLATMGVFGFVAFGGVVFILLSHLWTLLRHFPGSSGSLLALGLGGTLLVVLIHGIFDYFLSFIPTLGFFWMVAGLTAALHAQHKTTEEIAASGSFAEPSSNH